MPEQLLLAAEGDRRDVYAAASAQLGVPATIIEKDVWICWTLDVLFSSPHALPMAFKGGTSLSKVFRAINRFSEDIDLTFGFTEVNEDLPESRNKRDRLADALRDRVANHVTSLVLPELQDRLLSEFGEGGVTQHDAETLVVDYPSCYPKSGGYVHERVKVEFGGRNSIEPNASHRLTALVDELGFEIVTPSAQVSVLAPQRTFWEKVTLAHAECGRAEWKHDGERHSRHWYDLYMLADHEIGRSAIGDTDLLADVVRVKKAFWNHGTANYDQCLAGGLRILPDEPLLGLLEKDYEEMITAGMFSSPPPSFEDMTERLIRLEAEINETMTR